MSALWHALEMIMKVHNGMQFLLVIVGCLAASLALGVWYTGTRVAALQTQSETVARQTIESVKKELAAARAKQAEAEQALREATQSGSQPLQLVAGHPYESTRTMPRTISPIQRDKFLAMVSAVPIGSIELVSLLDDSDSYVLAVMLDDMLRRAGWSVSGIRRSLLPDNPIGLTMVVRSPETTPPFVPALQNALEAIGFPCAPIRNGDRPEHSVAIIVGHRPSI